jgi:cyanate permease
MSLLQKKRVMGTGWQLVEGFLALFGSVALTWWLFVAPSRAKRERRRIAREMKDPRLP